MKWRLILFGFFTAVLIGLLAIRTVWVAQGVVRSSSLLVALSRTKPLAVVVPHHNVVKEKRRELLKKLAIDSQPETILLLSPNHFGVGKKEAVTADYVWQLRGGAEHIDPDTTLIRYLLENANVENDAVGVRGDHGITNLLGDIHEFFPSARIVPILLRDTLGSVGVKRLVADILNVCEGRCGVIASVDMSHYQPARSADMHDVKTIRLLETADSEAIWNAEVDSRASLAFLMNWAKIFSLPHFNLFAHTNSGVLAGNLEDETTTHIFGYYESGTRDVVDSGATFTIAGSAFHCPLDQLSQVQFSDFGSRALWGADLSWVFWDSISGDFSFRDQLMREWHWSASSVPTGATAEGMYIQRLTVGGERIAFISAEASNMALETTIRQEKLGGQFVGVLPRWQGEYSLEHTEEQRKKTELWVRAGADMIVGFHEGGVQDMEVIDGAPVFYSVGGFLDVCSRMTQGLVINGVIEKKKLRITFDPVRAKSFDTMLLLGEDRMLTLRQMCSFEKTEGCLDGYIELQRTR